MTGMRITKLGHACVRIEHEGGTLVIDPGVWSDALAAVEGADAVLVTHEHADHVDVASLGSVGVPVFAPEGAAIDGLEVVRVRSGEEFTAAGLAVRAVGGRHALIYDGRPDCANLGYVVDGGIYHPGDSVHVPDADIHTLFVPAQASWLKLSEAVDFARAIAPDRAFAIHDAQVNDLGLSSINGWFGREIGAAYRYLAPGESIQGAFQQ